MQETQSITKPQLDTEHHLGQADKDHQAALAVLGEVATPKPAYIENGQVVTPGDAQRELAYRQQHDGQPSQETGTPR